MIEAKAVVRAPSSMSIRISAIGSLPVCSREPIVDSSSVYRVHAEVCCHFAGCGGRGDLLQTLHGLSNRQAVDAVRFDLRWKVACGVAVDAGWLHPSTLTVWRTGLGQCSPAADLRCAPGGDRVDRSGEGKDSPSVGLHDP